MYKQNLPTYKHKFLEIIDLNKEWVKVETDHYIFYYTNGSEAEKDIDIIKEIQEGAYKKIISFLSLQNTDKKLKEEKKKIIYYLYPNKEMKKDYMGDSWYAQSIYNEFCIHVLYTKDIKPIGPHEDTHLLTLYELGLSMPFIQEGLAEYMVGHAWDKKSHNEYVRDGLLKGFNMYPSKYLTKYDWFNTDDEYAIYFYSLAAEWTRFLIEIFGIEHYKSFYKVLNRELSSEDMKYMYVKYFDQSIESLELEFLNRI